MPKKKRPIDTEIVFFAFKVLAPLVLVLVIAIGIDISRLIG